MCGDRGTLEIYILYFQFFCEPKTALKNKNILYLDMVVVTWVYVLAKMPL